jgi:hypothetical protein
MNDERKTLSGPRSVAARIQSQQGSDSAVRAGVIGEANGWIGKEGKGI